MPEVTIKAGRASEIVQPERLADLEELRDQLESEDVAATLEIAEYVPGRRGLSYAEVFWIYIGATATTTLVSNVVTDIYTKAKKWAVARFQKKLEETPNGNPRPEAFTIYGPDGEVLKKFTIDKDGEHED